MENLLAKMKEYLQMDSEIDFKEFVDYYEKIMILLQSNYDGLENNDLFRARFILNIVSSNAAARARRKGPNMKKFKKIQEKTSFWSDAINYRLQNEGMTQQEIDQEVEAISRECDGSKQ